SRSGSAGAGSARGRPTGRSSVWAKPSTSRLSSYARLRPTPVAARIAEARGGSSPSGSPSIFAASSTAARPRAETAGQDDDRRATSFGLVVGVFSKPSLPQPERTFQLQK